MSVNNYFLWIKFKKIILNFGTPTTDVADFCGFFRVNDTIQQRKNSVHYGQSLFSQDEKVTGAALAGIRKR
jgi:hypothetical protein